MTKILVASSNPSKIKEIEKILKDKSIEVLSLKSFNENIDIVEDQPTFKGNAIKKAQLYANKFKIDTIADDSGLEVEVLNNMPGIYSKRYSGLSDEVNIDKLLYTMEDQPNRNARFICVIAYCTKEGVCKTYQGTWQGLILEKRVGTNGFGYDSIFFDPLLGKSAGSLSSEEKNLHSHRAKALLKFKEELR